MKRIRSPFSPAFTQEKSAKHTERCLDFMKHFFRILIHPVHLRRGNMFSVFGMFMFKQFQTTSRILISLVTWSTACWCLSMLAGKLGVSCVPNKLMCYPQQPRRSWKDFGQLARNLLEPHQPSAPEPSGPHQLSAPEPSGTSSAICTGTLRNLISHLRRNPPEPSPEPAVAAAPDRTRAILG